jgi:hypothetical protein
MNLNTSIALLERQLENVLSCSAFSYSYPHMQEHIIAETRFFSSLLIKLENMEDMDSIRESMVEELKLNWNDIMGDHAEFIRGYLDPTEEALFKAADAFAEEFKKLKGDAPMISVLPTIPPEAIDESLRATTDLRNFKMEGTQGILACKIRSIISPLLGDHVLREANHYIRLLRSLSTGA